MKKLNLTTMTFSDSPSKEINWDKVLFYAGESPCSKCHCTLE